MPVKTRALPICSTNQKKPKSKAATPSEKAIQAAIIRRLQVAGWLTIRFNSGLLRDARGGIVRFYTIAGLNAISGFPDICAFRSDGRGGVRCLLIEVKDEKGVLSESQKRFHEFAAARGVLIYVLRDPATLDGILED